jgi:hypothetical protein
MDQAGTYYGYITGTDRWILSPSTDLSFDSSEYEHFTVESVIFFTADLP